MTRGRKSQTTQQKKLAGNPGKRPLNEREPQPSRGLVAPRADMPGAVVEAYHEIADLLDSMGQLFTVDTIALEVAAYGLVQFRRTAQWMLAGMTQEITGDLKATEPAERLAWARSPMAIAHKQNTKELRASLAELGLNPTARSQLTTGGPPAQESKEEVALKPYVEGAG
jgi:phage terminase small subunit